MDILKYFKFILPEIDRISFELEWVGVASRDL